MKAEDARKIRDIMLSAESPAMKQFMLPVYESIRGAANRGESQVTDRCLPREMTARQRDAALNILRQLGYKVEHHAGDQRDPREVSYYSISW